MTDRCSTRRVVSIQLRTLRRTFASQGVTSRSVEKVGSLLRRGPSAQELLSGMSQNRIFPYQCLMELNLTDQTNFPVKNILRALEANNDIPPLEAFPRSHQVSWVLRT